MLTIRKDMQCWFNDKRFDFDVNKTFPVEDYTCLIWFNMSGRNRGKSFNIAAYCLYDAWENDRHFCYVRRDVDSCKPKVVTRYFANHSEFIRDLTNGKYDRIVMYNDSLYFAGLDEKGKLIRGRECGFAHALFNEEKIKSLQFPKIGNIIYEEIFTTKAYLSDEVNNLMSLISTIRRNKTNFNVFGITNTVSRLNPYTEYFALDSMRTIKPSDRCNTILNTAFQDLEGNAVVYHVCVDYLKDKGENLETGGNMIGTNKWEEKDLYEIYNYKTVKEHSEELCKVVFESMGFYYLGTLLLVNTKEVGIDNNNKRYPYLFIERKTTVLKPDTRVYSKRKVPYQNYCSKIAQNTFDKIIFILVKTNKILYSDNLTANEFQQVAQDIGII